LANFKHTPKELEELRAKREADRAAHTDFNNDRQLLTEEQWCRLNNFSRTTGKRILASGDVPAVVQLSLRRKGITVGANCEWQKRCIRKVG
jgi:hypothetical protein